MTCLSCEGTGTIISRVQRRLHGHRICHDETITCPVCNGRKKATLQDLDTFLKSCLPYYEETGENVEKETP